MKLTTLAGNEFFVNPNMVCYYGITKIRKGLKRVFCVAVVLLSGECVAVQESLDDLHRKMGSAITVSPFNEL